MGPKLATDGNFHILPLNSVLDSRSLSPFCFKGEANDSRSRFMSAFSSTRAQAATAAPIEQPKRGFTMMHSSPLTPAAGFSVNQNNQNMAGYYATQSTPDAESSLTAEDLAVQSRQGVGYHVEGLHAYIWSTQPAAHQQLTNLRDTADISSHNIRLSVYNNRCSLFCYDRGVELETVWAKDILSVSVKGGSVSLVPTPCSAESVDDHGETVVRKLLSGVVMKKPVQRPRVRTWAAIRLLCDSDDTAQELGTALEALKIRHMQTIPKRLTAENAELEKAMVLQHKARSLLASLGVRPEGVLSLASVGAAGPSPQYLDEIEEIVDEEEEEEEDDEIVGLASSESTFLPFGPVVQSLLSRVGNGGNTNNVNGNASMARGFNSSVGHPIPVAAQCSEPNAPSQRRQVAIDRTPPSLEPRQQQQQQSPIYQTTPHSQSYSPLPLVMPVPPLPPLAVATSRGSVSVSAATTAPSIAPDQTVINVEEVEEIFPSPRDDGPASVATAAGLRKMPPPVAPFSTRRPISPDDDDDDGTLSEVSADEGAIDVRRQASVRGRSRRQSTSQSSALALRAPADSGLQLQSEPAPLPREPARQQQLPLHATRLPSPRGGPTPSDGGDGERQRVCRWCGKPAPPQHDAKCKLRQVRCRKCGEPSLLRDIKTHVCST